MTLLPRTNFLHMNWGLRRRNDYAWKINWFFLKIALKWVNCMQITASNSTVMYMNSKLLSFRSDAMKQTNTSRLYVPWHVLRCFQKRIFFFLHLAFPAHVTVFSGAGLWKRVPEWRFVKTPEFRFHVDCRKRIFEYKMSYILQPRCT